MKISVASATVAASGVWLAELVALVDVLVIDGLDEPGDDAVDDDAPPPGLMVTVGRGACVAPPPPHPARTNPRHDAVTANTRPDDLVECPMAALPGRRTGCNAALLPSIVAHRQGQEKIYPLNLWTMYLPSSWSGERFSCAF